MDVDEDVSTRPLFWFAFKRGHVQWPFILNLQVPKRVHEKEVDPFSELALSDPEKALKMYQEVISQGRVVAF